MENIIPVLKDLAPWGATVVAFFTGRIGSQNTFRRDILERLALVEKRDADCQEARIADRRHFDERILELETKLATINK
jgi:hypothetical protein